MMYFGDYTLMYNALPFPGWLLILVIAWTVPWKGIALWRAARNHQKVWFIILLIVNSLAILEIFYLKFCQKECAYCSLNDGSVENMPPETQQNNQQDNKNSNINLTP